MRRGKSSGGQDLVVAERRAPSQRRARLAPLLCLLTLVVAFWEVPEPPRAWVAGRGHVPGKNSCKPEAKHGRLPTARLADAGSVAGGPPRSKLIQAWGAFGVVCYLGYGVLKVVPIVLDGLGAIEEWWQWGLLAATLVFFAYVEGYRGFQLGFSPRVVSRAYVVSEEGTDLPIWHKVFAPFFCIGYFHGTTRRVITSWAVTAVIFAVVIGVKQLANPYRAIIDAGVIVGLVWGIASIIFLFVNTIQMDSPPDFDPALPEDTPYTVPSP